ncbi:MAG: M23 family metallopeptidase [Clostridia bacterium]|nr:M23 family metallopeptidase [Clostridia bacterium]
MNGDLGNHFKIVNGDVMTVYAHCKTIYVKEGEKIIQGQNIGEVGSTGNSTGPHLHFEIRKNNRYVNPDLVLKF